MMRAIVAWVYRAVYLPIKSTYFLLNSLQLILAGVPRTSGLSIRGLLYLRSTGSVTIGKNVVINSSYGANPIGGNRSTSIIVEKGASLYIGNSVGISNTAIYLREGLSIGDRTLVGGDCRIIDSDFHSLDHIRRQETSDRGASKAISIGDNVFIGCGVTILKGAKVGNRSIIAAGAVVACNIPDDELWGGNPAQFIRKLASLEG